MEIILISLISLVVALIPIIIIIAGIFIYKRLSNIEKKLDQTHLASKDD